MLYQPWIRGEENIPAEGAAILASNHLAVIDSFFLPLLVDREVAFIGKADYFTGKGVKGWAVKNFMKTVGTIPVDRSGGKASQAALPHGIDPTTPGREIDEATWKVLWEDLVGLMAVALERGRIDTVADEHGPEAQERPPRVDAHGGEVYVYRRAGQPCLVCGTEVCTTVLEGRNLYWCSRCQRSHRASD